MGTAWFPDPWGVIEDRLTLNPLQVDTMYTHGIRDPYLQDTSIISRVKRYIDPARVTILEHKSGHVIPNSGDAKRSIIAFMFPPPENQNLVPITPQ